MFNTAMKENLLEYVKSITSKSAKGAYVCPLCGSGTGENKTGAFSVKDGLFWHCFSCGQGGDIYDLFALVNHCDNREAVAELQKLFPFTGKLEKNAASPLDYFARRGLSNATVERLGLKIEQNAQGYYNAVIPFDNGGYFERGIDNDYKHNNGIVGLFNGKDLYNRDGAPVFICEGWADAASFVEAGKNALSINSVTNGMLLVKALKAKSTNSPIVIAFDNDNAGKVNGEKLKNDLQAIGYNATVFLPTGENVKDFNDMLIKNRDRFFKEVDGIINNTLLANKNNVREFAPLENDFDGLLSRLWEGPNDLLNTGYKSLDDAIGGGFMPGVTVIGAESSHGKSCLCQNIAENIAGRGFDVLYFALEMSKLQLLARGLSKQSFLAVGKDLLSKGAFTAAEIQTGKATPLQLADAIANYRKTITKYLTIIENYDGLTVDDLIGITERHIASTGKKALIVIDYLQMLQGSEKLTEKQQLDNSMAKLKGLASKNNISVLAISSLNRASYGEPVKMESFKESGKIEYSADLVLGLSLSASHSSRKPLTRDEVSREMKQQPRAMIVEVLKGRNIESRKTVSMLYYSAYNLFNDCAADWEKYQARRKPI